MLGNIIFLFAVAYAVNQTGYYFNNRYCSTTRCPPLTHMYCIFQENELKNECVENPLNITDDIRMKLLNLVVEARKNLTHGKLIFRRVAQQPGRAYGLTRPYYSKELEKCAHHFAKQCIYRPSFNISYCCSTDEFPYTILYLFNQRYYLPTWTLENTFEAIRSYIDFGGESLNPLTEIFRPRGIHYYVFHQKTIAFGCSWYFLDIYKAKFCSYICAFAFYAPVEGGEQLYFFEKPNGTSPNCGCPDGWFEVDDCLCSEHQFRASENFTSTTSTQPPLYIEQNFASDYVEDIELPQLRNNTKEKEFNEEIQAQFFVPVFRINRQSSETRGSGGFQLREINPERLFPGRKNELANVTSFQVYSTLSYKQNFIKKPPLRTKSEEKNIVDKLFSSKVGEDYSDFRQVVLPER